MDPAEVRRQQPAARRSPSRTRPRSARSTTAATTRPRWTRRWRRPATRSCGRSRPSGAHAATSASSASGWPATSRSPAAATESGAPQRERHRRGPPRRHATILTGTSPHGQGHATAWAMLASEELGIPVDKITRQVGRHRPDPRGRRHRRLAQPAAGRRRGAAGRRRSWSTWPGSGPPRCSRPTPPTSSSTRPQPRSRWPGVAEAAVHARRAGRDGAAVRAHACSPRRARRSRSARTWPWSRSTPRPARPSCAGWSRVDDAGVVLNPLLAEGQRHGGIAQGAAQALLEEVVYDADGNPLTATLRRLPVPVRRPSCRASSWSTWRRRRRTTRWAPRASARPARSAPPRPCRTRSSTRVAHLGVRHIDMPTTPQRVWQAIQRGSRTGATPDAGRDHRQRRARAPTRSSRGCCWCTTCATCAGCGRPTSAATPPPAAPARCCSTASR